MNQSIVKDVKVGDYIAIPKTVADFIEANLGKIGRSDEGPSSHDTARWWKGYQNWTAEDHQAEKTYLDRRSGGRFFKLGAPVRVIATGEIGEIEGRTEPCTQP